ncbi:hypothetical protein PBT90_18115 [Algoriphagus halophytocola]|uniref:Cupin domain-containing protein n=1 Tax=Algoriphagus halophytocola TaxID=2991499 RepID=A0ABY6ME59_9BACT|nr:MULTISPECIES: hypothetical protein [unclassified Algoriphagus]UZD21433.1 hypothetical protein OM944_12245 [Algoriphagus sp. TR-M5]WBL42645.1 hypothetical protein PBT90_18115 [Algoriphagus sp. TR-M9]
MVLNLPKGLQHFMEDTGAEEGVVICRIEGEYPLSEKVKAEGLKEFLNKLKSPSIKSSK